VRGSLEEGQFTIFYLKDGVVKGALTVGRSDDLDHARRLIAQGVPLGEERSELGELTSDLAGVGVDADLGRLG